MRTQTAQKAELFAHALRMGILGVFAVSVSIFFLSLLFPSQTDAATSSTVNFQARLETSAGAIVPDGYYNVQFKLYDAVTSGTNLWTETDSYNSGSGSCSGPLGGNDCRVRVVNGYLTVNLGSVNPLGSLNWNQQMWLTMNIGGTVTAGSYPAIGDTEMSPRLQLTAVPYAFQAGQLGATSGANIATLSFTTPTSTDSILLPDASGTVCLQSASACGFATGSGTAILQGGNTFSGSTAADIGTNNSGALNLRTAGSTRLQVDTSGNLQFQQASTINVVGAGTALTLTIQGGAATTSGNNGGNLVLQGGAGNGTGVSGSVVVKSNASNSTSAFQIQNSAGTSTLLTADTTNMRVGVNVTYALMSTPTINTITATSSGSLTAGTYRYKVSAIDAAGGETSLSTEVSGVTASTNLTLPVTWNAIPGATGYQVYRTARNGLTGTEKYLTTVASNSFTDTNAIALTSTNPPLSSALAYKATNVSNSNLQLSLGGNGTPTGQLYVSGTLPSGLLSSVPGGGASSVYVQGRYAYAADQLGGTVYVIDVTNPAVPKITGSIAMPADPFAIYVQGRYAYVMSDDSVNNLYIVDVSNPQSPTLVSTLTGLGNTFQRPSIYVQGRYAYATNYSSNSLYVIDVSNPFNPRIVSTTSGMAGATAVQVLGHYAYVGTDGSCGLYVVDISNPAIPSISGSNTSSGCIGGLYVQGHYVYAAIEFGNVMQVFDVSNPASPTAYANAASDVNPWGIYVQGRYAYMGTNTGQKVDVYDISNPGQPTSIGTIADDQADNAQTIFVAGRYMYIAQGNFSSTEIQIYDLGGAYIQGLEVGGISTDSLNVDNNASISGDAVIQGGLQVNQSLGVIGDIGVNGNAAFISKNNSSTAFQLQNASNATILNVDSTTSANLLANGDFETSDGTTGWSTKGASVTLSQITTQQWQGSGALSILAPTNAGRGAQYSYALSTATQYTLSGYLKGSGAYTDITIGYHDNADHDCFTGTVSTTTWTRFTCTFTTGGSVSSGAIYIDKNSATGGTETFYADGVQLQTGAVASGFNAGASLQISGVINSPLAIENRVDSTTAFQVENAAGNNVLSVDTLSGRTNLGAGNAVTGALLFNNATNANTLILQSGVTSSSYTLTLPTAVGSTNQCLQATNSTGTLGWGTCAIGTFVSLQAGTPGTPDTGNFNISGTGIVNTLQVGTPSSSTGSAVFATSTGASTVTLQAGSTSSSYSILLPTAGGSASQCLQLGGGGGSQLQWGACGTAATGLTKNGADTSSASISAASFLYGFTNSNTTTAGGVLKLDNGSNTANALEVDATGNPQAGSALIFAKNSNASPSGQLISLQNNVSSGTQVFGVSSTGSVAIKTTTNSTTAFLLQDSSANSILTLDDSSTVRSLQIGSATTDGTAVLLIVDSYNTTDPTGTNGAIYYSTALNRFRCYENSAWVNCGGNTSSEFGDGSDGSVTFDGSTTILGMAPASNVYTLTRDIYCVNITVNGSVTIKTGGFRIFATGIVNNSGNINNDGAAGGNATAGAVGAAGTAGAANFYQGGTAGGAGGSAAVGATATAAGTSNTFGAVGGTGGTNTNAGGAGGTVSVLSTASGGKSAVKVFSVAVSNAVHNSNATTVISGIGGGTGGGGGGSSSTGNRGGGGGGGGGVVFIAAKIIINSGTISANGGAGGNGNASGGVGGGGGGGLVMIFSSNYSGSAATATGGIAGTSGTTTGSTAGTTGTVLNESI